MEQLQRRCSLQSSYRSVALAESDDAFLRSRTSPSSSDVVDDADIMSRESHDVDDADDIDETS
jgi:hypothetical protein